MIYKGQTDRCYLKLHRVANS